MSHDLEIRNGKAQMIYVGEKPWHGLGTEMKTPPKSIAEALAAAGMAGWNVTLERVYLWDGTPVDSYVTRRGTDGAILGTGHKSGYNPVQLEKAFAPVEAFIRSGTADIETAGSLKGGAKAWLLLKINRPDMVIVPKADDRVAKYLLVATSFDGSISMVYMITGVRVVCQNTLDMAFGDYSAMMRIKHTSGADAALRAVTAAIEKANAQFDAVADMFRALAGVNVTESQVREYIDMVFPPAPSKAARDKSDSYELDVLLKDVAPVPAPAGNDFASLLARPARLSVESAPESDVLASTAERATERRRVQDNVISILESGGRGLDLPGVKGTAWGAYNAVTEYLTWERGRNADNRMHAAWFGDVGRKALNAAADKFLG